VLLPHVQNVPLGRARETLKDDPAGCRALSLARHADAAPFDDCHAHVGYWDGMDVERIIDDIQQLQEMFEAPDTRPLSPGDVSAANRRHDDMLAHSPWFRLWQRYGICCRPESPYSVYAKVKG